MWFVSSPTSAFFLNLDTLNEYRSRIPDPQYLNISKIIISISESQLSERCNILIILQFKHQDHFGSAKVLSVVNYASSAKFWLYNHSSWQWWKRQKMHSLNLRSLDEISHPALQTSFQLIGETNGDLVPVSYKWGIL